MSDALEQAPDEVKRTLERTSRGEWQTEQGKHALVEANLCLVVLDREEVHESRAAVPRSDSGRQHRSDESGRQPETLDTVTTRAYSQTRTAS